MPGALNKPTFIESPVKNSGNMGGTGQLQYTQGGGQVFSRLSGVVAATLIASGPGRLDVIQWLSPLNSGTGLYFYDSAVATSGGPFQTSGHNIVGYLPAPINPVLGGTSGLGNQTLSYPYLERPGMPFHSGLCVGLIGTVSGVGGFTCSYTTAGLISGGGAINSVPAGGNY